jgi:glycerol-3-phosphate dehydrogenase
VKPRDCSALRQNEFDLLVIGGGIYGAWTAYDAAKRGLKVAIVEQADWAAATSSASSKLIHGGLRYLETYDFKLVRKALAERNMLLTCAPHRVWPQRFGVPIYADSRTGFWLMKAGLMLYDALANFPPKILAHRSYSKAQFATKFPCLKTTNLTHGLSYGDAQTDDARLVFELIAGAKNLGAVCLNYCQFQQVITTNNVATGAQLHDLISDEKLTVRARQIVNATGQWISTSALGKTWCRLSKGVHLTLRGGLTDEALLLTAPQDGRVFFIIPWYGMTLLGTTDEDYLGDINQLASTAADADYLLTAANHYLQSNLREEDIVARYAGIRVMQRSDAAHPSQLSRDWTLQTDQHGVHFSVGGKITSARVDAASIVDTVCKNLAIRAACATANNPFPWTPHEAFSSWYEEQMQRAQQLKVDVESAHWLLHRHGKNAALILDTIQAAPETAQRILASVPFTNAALLWCATYEDVVHLDDLLRRRLPILLLAQLDNIKLKNIAMRVASVLNWDAAKIAKGISRCISLGL